MRRALPLLAVLFVALLHGAPRTILPCGMIRRVPVLGAPTAAGQVALAEEDSRNPSRRRPVLARRLRAQRGGRNGVRRGSERPRRRPAFHRRQLRRRPRIDLAGVH
jgi:hypothetical protein